MIPQMSPYDICEDAIRRVLQRDLVTEARGQRLDMTFLERLFEIACRYAKQTTPSASWPKKSAFRPAKTPTLKVSATTCNFWPTPCWYDSCRGRCCA